MQNQPEKNSTFTLFTACLLGVMSAPSLSLASKDIATLNFESQADFKKFGESMTNVLGYKSVFPAEQLGLLGFDVGVSVNLVESEYKLNNSAQKDNTVEVLSLHANKGLPGGFDVALNYNQVFESEAASWSGELKYALIEGGTAKPAMAISGHYSQASGVNALDFSSYGVNLGLSKGFANLTPYVGIGYLNADLDPTVENQQAVSLSNQKIGLVTYNAGMNVNLMTFDLLVGYNQIGDLGTYTLKAGYRF